MPTEAYLVVPCDYTLTEWAGQRTRLDGVTSDEGPYNSTPLDTIKEYLEPIEWVAYTIPDTELVHEGYNFAPDALWSVVVYRVEWGTDIVIDVYMKGEDPGGFVQAEYGDIKILMEDLRDQGPSYKSACRALNYLDAICGLADEPLPEEPAELSEAESEETYRVFYPDAPPYSTKNSIEGILCVTVDESPSEKALALFEDRNPGFTLLEPRYWCPQVVQNDDVLGIFRGDDEAIKEFLRHKIPCVWLPDFMEGEEADDGSRCADGRVPSRLYLVWKAEPRGVT